MSSNQEMLTWTYQRVHKFDTETFPALPGSVWAVKIRRDSTDISALQELADCKTLGLENRELLKQIIAKLNEGA